jgi:hypothetical protein
VIALVMAPMVLTSRTFSADWSNNLWLVWEQSLNIKTLGHPSYFLQSGIGAFSPQFLFDGGTLFSIVGFLAAAAGEHPLAAYLLMYFLALVGAYGGWLWLCRQIGLSGWRAHIPAIIFTTSSYYVTNIYGRGDLGEMVATSAVPLAVAGALYLVRAKRWRVGPTALFAFAIILLTGSHSLTLVWGTTYLALLALALLIVDRRNSLRELNARRSTIAATLGVAAVAVGVNAWTIIPTLAYHGRVLAGGDTTITQLGFSSPGALFGVLRDTVNPAWIAGDVQTQVPVLAIGWTLVAMAASWRSAPTRLRRAVIGLTALLALLMWLTLSPGALGSMPKPWSNIQFPFRLITYVTLTACGLLACVLLMLRHAPARLRRAGEIAIALVALVSVALATHQVWDTRSFYFKSRHEVLASATTPPPSFYSGVAYADSSRPVVHPTITRLVGGTPTASRPAIELPSSPFTARYSYPIVVSRSGTVATNVAAGPYLVSVKGATPVGRTPLVPGGSFGSSLMVVRIAGSPGEHEVISFATAPSGPLRLGVIVTLVSLGALGLALLLIPIVEARGRSRRAAQAGRVGESPRG